MNIFDPREQYVYQVQGIDVVISPIYHSTSWNLTFLHKGKRHERKMDVVTKLGVEDAARAWVAHVLNGRPELEKRKRVKEDKNQGYMSRLLIDAMNDKAGIVNKE